MLRKLLQGNVLVWIEFLDSFSIGSYPTFYIAKDFLLTLNQNIPKFHFIPAFLLPLGTCSEQVKEKKEVVHFLAKSF